MSVVFAIPSYNRVETLETKTLATLKHYKIPTHCIYIFVANEDEKTKYEKISKSLYGHLIIAKKGLKNARNFITDYFPQNKPIVQMDDDIAGFSELEEDKLVPLKSLIQLVNEGFARCKESHLHLWGISPVDNPFYMKDTVSTDVKFIIGHFWGVINQKTIQLTMDYKEDYERTLQFLRKDKAVVRFNGIAAKTKLGAPGGLGVSAVNRLEMNKESSNKLLSLYPEYVALNPRRPGEILLRLRKGASKPLYKSIEDEKNDTRRTYIKIRDKKLFNKLSIALLSELENITIPKLSSYRSGIIGKVGRSMTFGYGYKIAAIPGPYRWNTKYPNLFEALIALGNSLVPIDWEYDSITLNNNMIANKHKDSKNVGLSVIIGIGNYTGGELTVWNGENEDSKLYDIHNKPLMFNGGLLYHEGTPFEGNRYTIVFYKQGYKGTKEFMLKGM